MNISKFPAPPPRECTACRVPLRPAERELCRPCSSGHDFLSAAIAYVKANPKPRRRRWAR
jgi:hypothetical protein